jgi:hypothetical protein
MTVSSTTKLEAARPDQAAIEAGVLIVTEVTWQCAWRRRPVKRHPRFGNEGQVTMSDVSARLEDLSTSREAIETTCFLRSWG